MNSIYRHGDVIFERVTSEPEQKPNAMDTKTMAYGEATGHHHTFTEESQVVAYGQGSPELIWVGEGATITHQEHAPITFTEGWYRVRIKREYAPGAIIRKVID